MKILPLTTSNIPDLVTMHKKTLTGLSGGMSDRYLTRFYASILTHNGTHDAFGAFKKSQLVGAIAISKAPRKTFAQLNQLITTKEVLHVALGILAKPMRFIDSWQRMRFNSMMRTHIPNDHLFLLLIMVAPKYQRKGVGTLLFKKIMSIVKHIPLWVDTGCYNTSALSFYQKHGFTKVCTKHRAVLLRK